MKRKFILIALALLLLTGCASDGSSKITSLFSKKPLAVLAIEDDAELVIDIRDEFDPNSILKDVEEGSTVTYELDEENSKVIITITKDDKIETLEKSVTIQYPLGVLKEDDITIDLNQDYNIEDLVNVTEGTEISYELDEETGKLTITLTSGDRVETIEKDVEVIPKETWPKHYICYDNDDENHWTDCYFYEDGTTVRYSYHGYTSTTCWTGDLKNGTIILNCDSDHSYPYYLDENGNLYVKWLPPVFNGNLYQRCYFIDD